MKVIRRILGVLVMVAGALGLVLSVAGLVIVWVGKPTVTAYASTTVDTLNESVVTSKSVMEITREALGGTIDSVDVLSEMLDTTAATVEDTKPVLDEFDVIMATTLPSTLEATTESLYTAQEAARVLESTIQSLDTFRFLLSDVPLVGDLLPPPGEAYSPEKPLSDSLGEIASSLEGLPDTFVGMSGDLSSTDEKLEDVQGNLITMSDSVGLIASSLSEYDRMIIESQSSMDDLTSILKSIQSNLDNILNWVGIALSLFFAWLLAAQVVILSQGWELYQGTADRMASDVE
jgi:methyl-accepting chemotaxis protein